MWRTTKTCIVLLTLILLAGPRTAAAQQPERLYRLGLLGLSPQALDPPHFLEELRRLGYNEGRNLLVERRAAETPEELTALAAALVQHPVDVLVTRGSRATGAAKRATTTTPIVFYLGDDPVQSGLIASFARPGGNLTGQVLGQYEAKALEILKEALPGVTRVACLCPTVGPTLRAAAQHLGLQLQGRAVQGPDDFDRFFTEAHAGGAEAVLVPNVLWFFDHYRRLGALTLAHRLPAIGYLRGFAEAGGLMSYGPQRDEPTARLAWQVARIFQGTPPADLPVEQPRRFELLINLQTAQALGLAMPPSLLFQADAVLR